MAPLASPNPKTFLFWTGPTTVALVDLACMYLWRFAIEHMFRFLKQDMGLTKANSPLVYRQWVWACAGRCQPGAGVVDNAPMVVHVRE